MHMHDHFIFFFHSYGRSALKFPFLVKEVQYQILNYIKYVKQINGENTCVVMEHYFI